MGKRRQVSTAWLLDRIEDDVIDLPSRPKATTDVIPFRKPRNGEDRENFIGRSLHALYDLEDEDTGKKNYSFYKGEIVRAVDGGKYRLEFQDGDVMEVDFCAPNDTFLWETGDVTQGGRWKLDNIEEGLDEEIDIGGGEETKVPHVQMEPGNGEAKATKVKAAEVKAAEVKAAEVKAAEVKVEAKVEAKVETNPVRSPPDAMISGSPNVVPLASKKNDRSANQSGPSHSQANPSSGRQPPAKKAATVVSREKPRPKMDETTELRSSIQSAGKEFINALRALQTASLNLGTLNTSLKTYMLRADVNAEQLASVAKVARGLMNHLLRPTADFRNANDMGLEKVWPVNDVVMKPVSMLFTTTGSICQKAKLPPSVDGGVLENWRKSSKQVSSNPAVTPDRNDANANTRAARGGKKEGVKDRKREREQDPTGAAEATTSNRGNTDGGPSIPKFVSPYKVGRKDLDIFPSTGSKVRDDALKILAHSLTSSGATPYELAVDIEAAVHKSFPPSDKGTFPDEYYSSVMGARDVLNTDSSKCRHIFRMMILEGFLSPEEFISNSTEELEAQLEAFRKKFAIS